MINVKEQISTKIPQCVGEYVRRRIRILSWYTAQHKIGALVRNQVKNQVQDQIRQTMDNK